MEAAGRQAAEGTAESRTDGKRGTHPNPSPFRILTLRAALMVSLPFPIFPLRLYSQIMPCGHEMLKVACSSLEGFIVKMC